MINKQNGNTNDIFKAFATTDKQEKEKIANQMLNKLNSEESRMVNEIMSDKDKLMQIINSDAAKNLLRKLNKHKDG